MAIPILEVVPGLIVTFLHNGKRLIGNIVKVDSTGYCFIPAIDSEGDILYYRIHHSYIDKCEVHWYKPSSHDLLDEKKFMEEDAECYVN